ncbi:enoyl-CoA hydratase [Testudinibacter sp. P27/CKL/0425]
MTEKVYLAFYKGRKTGKTPTALLARFSDWLTRKLTKGIYSHCEIVSSIGGCYFDCYSSSIRDGGVRLKTMPLPPSKWDLIELNSISETDITAFLEQTQGKKYDWFGAIGIVLNFRNARSKYFCSEWCAETLGLHEPWRFSPNDLAAIYHKK